MGKKLIAAMILLMEVIKLNGHSYLCLGRAVWFYETSKVHIITNTVRTKTCKDSLRLY